MVAAKAGGVLIGTNTLYANRVFPALVTHRLFPELDRTSPRPAQRGLMTPRERVAELRSSIRPRSHGRSRFDFQVGGMMVEVKSVTLASGAAGLFPDAVSARAARHCDELAALVAVRPSRRHCLRGAAGRCGVGGAGRRDRSRVRRRAPGRRESRRAGDGLRARHHAAGRDARPPGAGAARQTRSARSLQASSSFTNRRHRQCIDPVFRAEGPLPEEDENPA